MRRIIFLARAASLSGLVALAAIPVSAYAGQAEQARIAIAAARSKIEAADKIGAGGELQARAHAALLSAETSLKDDHKETAIAEARKAGELADLAISSAGKQKATALRAERRDSDAEVAAAERSSAISAARADNAAQAADMANARAQNAEQAAGMANARADAMQAAPAPETTVTTETERTHTTPATVTKKTVRRAPVRHAKRPRVVQHKATTVTDKSTTTVTTRPQ